MIKQQTQKGFTLVEMMVAIAVFSIVMVTAMSALLNVIDANNKARSIKTAINNISLALEGISKDMRMGTDYGCIDSSWVDTTCDPAGNIGISFKSSKAGNPNVFYLFEENGEGIGQILIKVDTGDSSPITSTEVDLSSVKFYVLNDDPSTSEKEQPRMIMTVSGTAGPQNKPKVQTSFDLQTGVSQRQRI